MNKKRAKLTKGDIESIKKSKLSSGSLAAIYGCSIGSIDYYRRRGIWSKRKINKRSK